MPIPVVPSITLVERMRTAGPDISDLGAELDPANSVAEVFQTQSQGPTAFQLHVFVRFRGSSKWQNVNTPYHSVNLVLLLP